MSKKKAKYHRRLKRDIATKIGGKLAGLFTDLNKENDEIIK